MFKVTKILVKNEYNVLSKFGNFIWETLLLRVGVYYLQL